MSWIYPRRVAITRPQVELPLGAGPYSAEALTKEIPVAANIPASIQLKGGSRRPDPMLPADTSSKTLWRVFIPAPALADGTVQTRDILTDDLGQRYQVIGPYWNSLGYNLLVERLEN